MRRRREDDAAGAAVRHRVEHVAGTADIQLVLAGCRVDRPGTVNDDLGALDGALHRGSVTDVAMHERRFARPAFGPTTCQADDLVAGAEQAHDDTTPDYSAGSGDGNLHGLVVVVEERGIDQIVEVHCCEVFFLVLFRVGTAGLVGQPE